MNRPMWPVSERDLLERFPIRLPDGGELRGAMYRTSARRCGRRIIVKDMAGEVLFDTDECYDVGNAANRLECWLEDLLRQRPTLAVAQVEGEIIGFAG